MRLVIEPNPPIFLKFLLFAVFFDNEDMNLTKLFAALILTPLFSYVRLLFFIYVQYIKKKK